MTDTSKMGMTALIALYNEKAAALGKEAATEFKTTKAAREAIAALDATPETEESGAAVLVPATDNSKYASTGKRGPNQGVGAFCKELILEGKTNAEVLEAVAVKFPTAKTSKGCIAYYRTALTKAAKKAEAPVAETTEAQADMPADEPALV